MAHLRLRAKDNIKLSAGTNVELLAPVLFSHSADANLAELNSLDRVSATAGQVIAWSGSAWGLAAPDAGPTVPTGEAGPPGDAGRHDTRCEQSAAGADDQLRTDFPDREMAAATR